MLSKPMDPRMISANRKPLVTLQFGESISRRSCSGQSPLLSDIRVTLCEKLLRLSLKYPDSDIFIDLKTFDRLNLMVRLSPKLIGLKIIQPV